MRIAIVTDNEQRADGIRQILQAGGASHSVLLIGDGVARLGPVLDQGQADLFVLDEVCCTASDLALLEQLSQRHPHAAFVMLCPAAPSELLIHAMRIGVRDVLPVPVSPEALQAAVARVEQKLVRAEKPQRKGKVLAFIACKGGSGATFLASNLGYALAAEHGKRVALIDLNLQFGDASLFVSDKVPATTLSDVANNISRLDASFLASSLVHVLPN
ncbi:MAG: AAA family ATPase, partial [Sulfuricella sp.]|nr:AAA family ATPase [Sulfuricella sp.]